MIFLVIFSLTWGFWASIPRESYEKETTKRGLISYFTFHEFRKLDFSAEASARTILEVPEVG